MNFSKFTYTLIFTLSLCFEAQYIAFSAAESIQSEADSFLALDPSKRALLLKRIREEMSW